MQQLPQEPLDSLQDVSKELLTSFQNIAIFTGERISTLESITEQMIDLSVGEINHIRDKILEQ